MARIRTIKPEFPQSESIGRLSRDARLLFIMLWTYVDDSGRARAASRMLASLLYPYDDDARDLLPAWLSELEAEQCIRRYEVDGSQYLEVCNWLMHQKIDRPTPSKIPGPPEAIASNREPSRVSSDGSVSGSGPVPVPGSVSLAPEVPRQTFDGWTFIDQRMRPAYPRGTYRHTHWIAAARTAERLVTEDGVTADAIVAGCERYLAQQQALGNEGTQYVVNPERFLVEKRFTEAFPIPSAQSKPGMPAEDPEAVLAWERLLATEGAERPPRVHSALQAIGGWPRVRERTAKETPFLRREFLAAFVNAKAAA